MAIYIYQCIQTAETCIYYLCLSEAQHPYSHICCDVITSTDIQCQSLCTCAGYYDATPAELTFKSYVLKCNVGQLHIEYLTVCWCSSPFENHYSYIWKSVHIKTRVSWRIFSSTAWHFTCLKSSSRQHVSIAMCCWCREWTPFLGVSGINTVDSCHNVTVLQTLSEHQECGQLYLSVYTDCWESESAYSVGKLFNSRYWSRNNKYLRYNLVSDVDEFIEVHSAETLLALSYSSATFSLNICWSTSRFKSHWFDILWKSVNIKTRCVSQRIFRLLSDI